MARKDRQFVDALARGLKILEAFSRLSASPGAASSKAAGLSSTRRSGRDLPTLSNSEIAKTANLAPSTVSRLTHTLTALGYLRLDPNARRYVLTPKNLMLGYPVLVGLSLLERARPAIERLATETGETVCLGVRDALHMIFVEVIQGHNLVSVRFPVGARLPIAVSAAGMSILAALPDLEQRTLAARIRAYLTQRGDDVAAFDQRLKQARSGKVAIVRDAWRRGIGGVSVALIQPGGQLASLTISVPTGSVSEEEMRGRLTSQLLDATEYLSSDAEASSTKVEPRKSGRRGH